MINRIAVLTFLITLLSSDSFVFAQKIGANVYSPGFESEVLKNSNTVAVHVFDHSEDRCWTNKKILESEVESHFSNASITSSDEAKVRLHIFVMASGLKGQDNERVGCIGFIQLELFYEGMAYGPEVQNSGLLHRVFVGLKRRIARSSAPKELDSEFLKVAIDFSNETIMAWNKYR